MEESLPAGRNSAGTGKYPSRHPTLPGWKCTSPDNRGLDGQSDKICPDYRSAVRVSSSRASRKRMNRGDGSGPCPPGYAFEPREMIERLPCSSKRCQYVTPQHPWAVRYSGSHPQTPRSSSRLQNTSHSFSRGYTCSGAPSKLPPAARSTRSPLLSPFRMYTDAPEKLP